MFRFFSYISLLLSLFLLLPPALPAADHTVSLSTNNTWHTFMRFLDAGKGSRPDGMAELKRYFHRFGYLPKNHLNFSDLFDDEFEQALLSYQKNLGLHQTGKLDSNTMSVVVSPRCGVSDFIAGDGGLKTTRRFAYFDGNPQWVRPSPMVLTYAFSPTCVISYLPLPEIKSAFSRAFQRWSVTIPVSFKEAEDYSSADIKIGWYSGDHGDGEAFDGMLGVLAHAFSPENGWFHLDAAERWAVDLREDESDMAIDLESVATHEIGHVLGLAHSSVEEAIMYPILSPRTKKVELRRDDVEGIQGIYGPNPNSTAELSSGRAMDWERRMWSAAMAVVACLFSLLL